MKDELEQAQALERFVDNLNAVHPAQLTENEVDRDMLPLMQLAAQFKASTVQMPPQADDLIKAKLLNKMAAQSAEPSTVLFVSDIQSVRSEGYANHNPKLTPPTRNWRKTGLYAISLIAGLAVFIIVISILLSANQEGGMTTSVLTTPSFDLKATYQGHDKTVRGLVFSPDSKTLVSGDLDGSVIIWDAQGHPAHKLTNLGDPLFDRLKWLPDGKTFLSANLTTWDKDGHESNSLPPGFLAFSTNGNLIAVSSQNQPNVLLLQGRDGEIINQITLPNGTVNNAVLSSDGKTLATSSFESENATPGSQAKSPYGPGDVRVRIWRLDGTALMTFNGYNRPVNGLAWSPDGQLLAVSSKGTTQEGEVARIWDHNGRLVAQLEGQSDVIWDLAWSPDSQWVAGACGDGKVRLWNRAGRLITTLDSQGSGGVWAVTWSPDGKILAAAGDAKTVLLWKVGQ